MAARSLPLFNVTSRRGLQHLLRALPTPVASMAKAMAAFAAVAATAAASVQLSAIPMSDRSTTAAAMGGRAACVAARCLLPTRAHCCEGLQKASAKPGCGCTLRNAATAAPGRRAALLASVAGPTVGVHAAAAETSAGRGLWQRLLPKAQLTNPRAAAAKAAAAVGKVGADASLTSASASAAAAATAAATYPPWLFGEWEVTSVPVSYAEPLGPRFVDADTRAAVREDFDSESTDGKVPKAKAISWRSRFYWASLDETGVPLKRGGQTRRGDSITQGGSATASMPSFGVMVALPAEVATPRGTAAAAARQECVVQYRSFNAAQEVRAFLGQKVPRVLSDADPRARPLQVMVAYPVLEGDEEVPRVVRLSLDACSTEEGADENSGKPLFVSSETYRQVVSTNGEVDTVGDFEVINAYRLEEAGIARVSVRNRVVKYLVQGDELYKEAGDAAVSWLDYRWDMTRLKTCIETPYGEQCTRPV